MNDQAVLLWLCSSIWLIGAISAIILLPRRVKNKDAKPFFHALTISHLIAPTLVGGWNWALPLPATYALYGYIIAIPFEEFFVFKSRDAVQGIGFSLLCWGVTFGICSIVVGLVKDEKKDRQGDDPSD